MTRSDVLIRLGGLLRYDLDRKVADEPRGGTRMAPTRFLRNHAAVLQALRSGEAEAVRRAFRNHFLAE